MSVTTVPMPVRMRLWGKAGGRCEYAGCNTRLWLDSLTKVEFNTSYLAHIIADEPDGPRGDQHLSKALAKQISNLMLLCDAHHRLIDIEDVAGHDVKRLESMKALHEQRIDLLTDIREDKRSQVLLYGANIGVHGSPLSYQEAALGMAPDRYPATNTALNFGLQNSSFEDRSPRFWDIEAAHLRTMIELQLRPRIKNGDVAHLSIFALAPQPLLILLGALLSDISFVEVYQRRKEPQSWKWEAEPADFEFDVMPPGAAKSGDAALILSLSATVTDPRVVAVVGSQVPIWRVTIGTPHNDFVRSRAQTLAFRKQMRLLLDRIKEAHGEDAVIHVFPAMPVSFAVDFGRILNPKSDLPLVVYDENKQLGGFARALEVNPRMRGGATT